MDIFGVGPMELLLILVIALIVFGPGKLPEVGAQLGRIVREIRKATNEFTAEFTREVESRPEKSTDERDKGAVG